MYTSPVNFSLLAFSLPFDASWNLRKIRDIVTKKFRRIWYKDQYPYLGCGDLGNSCELALFALILYD
jgi:hypothetical protein